MKCSQGSGLMTEFITSKDGTRIAYDRVGSGPAIILIAGAMQFRAFDPTTTAMAGLLAERCYSVINFDRRGRGETASSEPMTLGQTIDDIAALIEAAGGEAAVFGSSSGGAIALAAAAAGLPITGLVLWEVPLGDEGGSDGAEFLDGLRQHIRAGHGDETIEYFMKDMPAEWLAGAKASGGWPIMVAMGPSLEPDSESLAWTQSAPRVELWKNVTQPTAVLVGEQTGPIMHPAADSMVASLPNASKRVIPAANHSWEPEVMAQKIAEFLAYG
jgi:pimeloyl-ACP methyl ester carboxylesterase